jgi:NTP pyrophosphatase (non-canonical NTP hydrolase)
MTQPTDCERWRKLAALVRANSVRTGIGGGVILCSAEPNEHDPGWASIQALDHENPRNTLWISEGSNLEEAIDGAPGEVSPMPPADPRAPSDAEIAKMTAEDAASEDAQILDELERSLLNTAVDGTRVRIGQISAGVLLRTLAALRERAERAAGSLSFGTLRAANRARLPQFRDAKGRLSHSRADGSDWSPAQWALAVTGELGELCNLLKKVQRGDFTEAEALPDIRKEFADVVIYLDIFASQFGIDLGDAVRDKFNEVSRRVCADVFIAGDAVRSAPTPTGDAHDG